MAPVVYVLCFLTSLACTILLLNQFRRSRVRLLLWSGLCFLGFALNNAMLFVDRIVYPKIDLFWFRTTPALVGLILLVYGLTWDAE